MSDDILRNGWTDRGVYQRPKELPDIEKVKDKVRMTDHRCTSRKLVIKNFRPYVINN